MLASTHAFSQVRRAFREPSSLSYGQSGLKHQTLTAADVQGVQMSLEEVLAEQPDAFRARGEDARRVAHEVLDRRMRRTDAAFAYQTKEQEAEIARIERRSNEKIRDAELRAAVAEQSAETDQRKVGDLEARLDQLQAAMAERDVVDEKKRRTRRRLVPHLAVFVLLAMCAIGLTVWFLAGDGEVGGSILIAAWVVLAVFVAASIEVVHDIERPWWLAMTSFVLGPAAWLLLELTMG